MSSPRMEFHLFTMSFLNSSVLCISEILLSVVLSSKPFSLFFSQQGLMILLQNLPTMHWGNEEVSVLLAEAYRLKFAFADAPNHYKR